MPELPDLQVFSRNLNNKLAGKTLKEIDAPNSKKLNVPLKELKSTLEKQKLEEIYRDGKELFFRFNKGDILSMHLMLRGNLYLYENSNEHKYPIAELLFTDGTGLVLTDFQGQAAIALNPEPKKAPDALSDKIDLDFLKEQLGQTKANIKNFLLDQHKIRGIGNAYADEILWDAGISPLSVCSKIPKEKIKGLTKSIKTVLTNAEKQILKTHPEIISGEVRDFLKIHNSKKKQSPSGAPIHISKSGSRKTYYTEEQEDFK